MLSESGLLHIAATVANNTLRGAVGLQSSKVDCCAPLCCVLKRAATTTSRSHQVLTLLQLDAAAVFYHNSQRICSPQPSAVTQAQNNQRS